MNRRIANFVSISTLAIVALIATGLLLLRAQRGKSTDSKDEAGAHCDNPGGQKASKKLPAGTVLLSPSDEATFTGDTVCGHCTWGIGDSCNLMLWDRASHHVVQILPNQKLAEIQKIVGTCASGDHSVVAKGVLTQYDGMNYLLMSSYEATPIIKQQSAVEKLADDGMTERFEHKDNVAAEKVWTTALAQIEQPGVDPMAKYKVYGGLAGIHADRKEYAESRDLYAKAVVASQAIKTNKKPLAYSYYNLACAEGLLGQNDLALQHLTLAIETQHAIESDGKTNCNKYDQMGKTDEAFVALHDDARFQKLFAAPTAK